MNNNFEYIMKLGQIYGRVDQALIDCESYTRENLLRLLADLRQEILETVPSLGKSASLAHVEKLESAKAPPVTWIPWKLSPDSDAAERWILVSGECDEIEHPANVLYETEAEARAACEKESK